MLEIESVPDRELRGVDLFVRILGELFYEERFETGTWLQGVWARAMIVEPLFENGELLIDEQTGLPVGGSCGTGMCVAGWGSTIAGSGIRWELPGYVTPGETLVLDGTHTKDGVAVSDEAARLLELTRQYPAHARFERATGGDAVNMTFAGENSIDDVVSNGSIAYGVPESTLRDYGERWADVLASRYRTGRKGVTGDHRDDVSTVDY